MVEAGILQISPRVTPRFSAFARQKKPVVGSLGLAKAIPPICGRRQDVRGWNIRR